MARRMKEEERQFEDVSSYSSSKEYKKRRKNRQGRTGFFACCLSLLAGC